jgi:hypothetical protein
MLPDSKIRRVFSEIIGAATLPACKMSINIEIFGGKLDIKKIYHGVGPLCLTDLITNRAS